MPLPSQTFPNFSALATYINSLWVPNGVEEITGEIGNNVVNGLLTFIQQSPLNWQLTDVIANTGNVTIQRPVNVFTATPLSISFGDNIYNEYVFINTTPNPISISGLTYRDINLSPQNIIAAKQTLVIFKSKNGLWIQGNNSGGIQPSVTPKFGFLQVVVGVTLDGDGNVIMDDTATSLTISQANVIQDSAWVTNGVEVPRSADGIQVQCYTPVYTQNDITFNFLQSYSDNDVLIFHYAYLTSQTFEDTFDDTFDSTFF